MLLVLHNATSKINPSWVHSRLILYCNEASELIMGSKNLKKEERKAVDAGEMDGKRNLPL